MRVSDRAAVPFTAVQAVVTATGGPSAFGVAGARDTVHAGSSEDPVVASAARVPVGSEAVAGDEVVSVAAEQRVVSTAERIAADPGIGGRQLRAACRDVACQLVVARSGVDPVVAKAADQDVIAIQAADAVVAP